MSSTLEARVSRVHGRGGRRTIKPGRRGEGTWSLYWVDDVASVRSKSVRGGARRWKRGWGQPRGRKKRRHRGKRRVGQAGRWSGGVAFSRVYFVKHPLITTGERIAVVVRGYSGRGGSSHTGAVLYAYRFDVDPKTRAQIIKSGPSVQSGEGTGGSGDDGWGWNRPHTHAFLRWARLNHDRKKRSRIFGR